MAYFHLISPLCRWMLIVFFLAILGPSCSVKSETGRNDLISSMSSCEDLVIDQKVSSTELVLFCLVGDRSSVEFHTFDVNGHRAIN